MSASRDPDGDFLSQRLRQADIDGDPIEDDVDRLVGTAMRQGRHRVVIRRLGAAVVGALVLTTGIGLGVGVLPGRNAQLGPATSPTAVPSSTPSTSVTPSAAPTRLTRREVEAVIADLLPAAFTVADVVGTDRNTGQMHATLLRVTVADAAGTAWLTAGLIPEPADYACQPPRCTITERDGGELWVAPDARDPDKTGRDSFVRFVRPDGRAVDLLQQNFDGGNDPVTRSRLPLTDEQAIAFVTDPAWDALAARCRPHGSYC